ncbi:solute carrier family 2, facilitated glucose transporter member 12 isoform X2 [Vombatus ursinus]|uniref:solute carrier family 2, facilitated glucose transporter member 12 isoform X2 n=1 Tax=Vombatus ursinus TaxID=29139 RepID=UPI000FFD6A6F|nr:solute carrier family 2, facilitated glucose transporter member 12 isoform X2 [Vombatus ursinus]
MIMVPVQKAEEPSRLCHKMRAAESDGNDSPGGARRQLPAPRGCGMFTFLTSVTAAVSGLLSNEAASLASTGVGVVKVISTIPATLFVDQVGSKTFLCLGTSVMAASLVTMGLLNLKIHINSTSICRSHTPINHSLEDLTFYEQGKLPVSNNSLKQLSTGITPNSKSSLMSIRSDTERQGELTWASVPTVGTSRPSPVQQHQEMGPDEVPEYLKWLSLVSLLFYVAAFSIGLGPMPWLVLSEIFPGGIRGRAMALTSSMNWGINLLVSLTFLTVTELIGLPWVCFIYTIMSLAALVFVVLFIPETKGCSLEQISMELAKSNYVKHNIYLMSHQRKKLVPMELQTTKHQEQFLECKRLYSKEQSKHLFQEN